MGLYGKPNSLPGGFGEVELEGDETVAGVGSTPVLFTQFVTPQRIKTS
jgi:hypothetical protein